MCSNENGEVVCTIHKQAKTSAGKFRVETTCIKRVRFLVFTCYETCVRSGQGTLKTLLTRDDREKINLECLKEDKFR